MTDKSYVTLEQHVCVVCGQKFDTGSLLLDQRLRKTFEHKTLTGWGHCPEHKKLHDEGYIALVEIDPDKSDKLPNGNISPSGAWRTGRLAHIRMRAFMRLFNIQVPEGQLIFIEPGVIEKLEKLQHPADRAANDLSSGEGPPNNLGDKP